MTQAAIVVTALSSALAAATSSVLQHRGARAAPVEKAASHRLIGHLLTHPVWLVGLLVGGVGLVLHALALAGGRLAMVQPLLVCGLLFALPVSVLLEGRRPSVVEWLWAVVLVGGLSGFLLAGKPSAGRVPVDADVLAITTVAGCLVAAFVALVGLRWPGRHGAALLGTAAGLGYGVSAALLKQTTTIAAGGLLPVVTDWPVYVLLAVGAATIALTQLAYRAGPLTGSMPALTVTDPAASVAIGALAFHERLADNPLAVAFEVLGFLVMFAASAELARRSQHH